MGRDESGLMFVDNNFCTVHWTSVSFKGDADAVVLDIGIVELCFLCRW